MLSSLPYLAPEQFVDSQVAWPAVDIYSAGATLYHWLTGSTPHDFMKRRCQFLAILEDDPVPIQQRQSQIPLELAALVHRALTRDPRNRFPTAASMSEALRPFIAS
jgi:serine/threonine-protein kinase